MADDFESITESAQLVTELRARVDRDGPITFRQFMDSALYHPKYGYYRTQAGATSRGGDYVTSPEVHPIFGVMVARQLLELWKRMDEPPRFDIVEAGPGRGLLARDILAWIGRSAPQFAAAVRVTLVETSPLLERTQRETLADAQHQVTWSEALPRAISGVVLSNELLDAFPVHRVRREGEVLREIYVAWRDGRFEDAPGPLSDNRIAAYFEAIGLLPGQGCLAEVNLDAPEWMRNVASSLERGYVLTFDYGYEARELYAPWRRDGSLLCFYRQSAGSDPYQRIGKQDITASIDFTTLRRAGEEAGLRTIGLTDQCSFLTRLGIGEGLSAVGAGAGENAQLEEYFARRNVVMSLIDPARLGRIKVLLQGKGVPETAPQGFSDA